jgi:hypothetical protein
MSFANVLTQALAGRWEILLVAGGALSLAVLAFVGSRRLFARAPAPVEPKTDAPPPDPFLYGSPSEQRRSARRKGGVLEILVSDAQAQAEPSRGYILDRSLGGMRLCVKQRTLPGTIVTVRTADAPATVPWVEVEVRSCRQNPDGWELGVQFVRTPPMGVLLSFH